MKANAGPDENTNTQFPFSLCEITGENEKNDFHSSLQKLNRAKEKGKFEKENERKTRTHLPSLPTKSASSETGAAGVFSREFVHGFVIVGPPLDGDPVAEWTTKGAVVLKVEQVAMVLARMDGRRMHRLDVWGPEDAVPADNQN